MKHPMTLTLSFLMLATTLSAQHPDLNRPFGWANCTSLTSGDDYHVTGGMAVASPSTITLTNTGSDMRNTLIKAIQENDIIILDGSKGDFTISSTMRFKDLQNKTIVGINNARICTQFFLSPEIHQLMNEKKVLEQHTSKADKLLTLSNGKPVGEPREYLVRQTLIDQMQDPEEKFRNSGLFNISNCQNIIIRNLTLQGPGAIDVGGDDLLTLSRGSQHIWVDHVEFIDGMDGNFDINSFSDFITVTWCRFRYTERTYIHANTNLVGSSDRAEQNGEDNLNVTFAYCEWGEGCDQRMPMVRFGTIHLLNDLYTCAGNSAAANPRFHSEFRIEGCYFAKGVKRIFSQKDPKAFVFVGNHYTEPFEQPTDLGSVTLPYRYEAIAVEDVPPIVGKQAGATLSDPLNISKE